MSIHEALTQGLQWYTESIQHACKPVHALCLSPATGMVTASDMMAAHTPSSAPLPSSWPSWCGELRREVWEDRWDFCKLLPLPVWGVYVLELVAQGARSGPATCQRSQEGGRPAHMTDKDQACLQSSSGASGRSKQRSQQLKGQPGLHVPRVSGTAASMASTSMPCASSWPC